MRWIMTSLLSLTGCMFAATSAVLAQAPAATDRPATQDSATIDTATSEKADNEKADNEKADGDKAPAGRAPRAERAPGAERGAGQRPRGPGGPGPFGGGRMMMMTRMPVLKALDEDGDGEISASEIEGAVAALEKLDKNSDGKLSVDELLPEAMPGGPGGIGGPGDPTEMVDRMFMADVNKDGFVDKDEAPERMQPLFERADSDADGKLSREELTKFAAQMGGRRGGPDSGRGDAPRRNEGERPGQPTRE